eukprot:tig00020603_g11809.t1
MMPENNANTRARGAQESREGGFWVKGSVSQCSGPYAQSDFHINGNAMYAASDIGFKDYLQRVRGFYGPAGHVRTRGCSGGNGGFDHSVYQFSRDPANWPVAQTMLHRLQYSTFVLNHCIFPYRPWEILARHPAALLVHSKWANWRDPWDPRQHVKAGAPLEEVKASLRTNLKVLAALARRSGQQLSDLVPSVTLEWARLNGVDHDL